MTNRKDKSHTSEYNRHYAMQKRFGISVEQYDSLAAQQGDRCAICREAESVIGRGNLVQRLVVDHCHNSNKIRGLLCTRCNRVLGMCKDNTELLQKMAVYINTADTGLKTKLLLAAIMLEELCK